MEKPPMTADQRAMERVDAALAIARHPRTTSTEALAALNGARKIAEARGLRDLYDSTFAVTSFAILGKAAVEMLTPMIAAAARVHKAMTDIKARPPRV